MKRAIIAVAHTMSVIGYRILKTNQGHRELVANYLDRLHKLSLQRYHVKRLQNLGFAIALQRALTAS